MTPFVANAILWAALAVGPIKSFVQDPSTGIYTLVYADKAGTIQTVYVRPANRIDGLVHVEVQSASPGGFQFSYGVENRGVLVGAQPIRKLFIPCPETNVALSAPAPWYGRHVDFRDSRTCRFATNRPLGMGTSQDGLRVMSSELPAIAVVTLAAESTPVPWPSGEATPDEAYELADQVTLPQTGGLSVTSIAPIRPQQALADPVEAVRLIRADLAQACGLGWVSPAGICQSLAGKLEHALAGGSIRPQILRALLSELEAQRGKHVSSDAFFLLATNVDYLLRRMEPTLPR